MNANSIHLDLEDLIAEVTGETIGDQAREHLASCEQCQLEAKRWSLVAHGVRDLAAEAAEAPQPARPPRGLEQAQAAARSRAARVTSAAQYRGPTRRTASSACVARRHGCHTPRADAALCNPARGTLPPP